MQIDVSSALLDPRVLVVAALAAVALDGLVPVLPSGSLVVAASLFTAGHPLAAALLAMGVAAASFLGDLAVVTLARKGSGRVQARVTRNAALASATRLLADRLGQRMGRATVLARFIPAGRTALGMTLGVSPATQARYLRWSALGGLLWACYLVGLGVLNSLWLETQWVGFAVSVCSALVISACLASRLRHGSGSCRTVALVQPVTADGSGESDTVQSRPCASPARTAPAAREDARQTRWPGRWREAGRSRRRTVPLRKTAGADLRPSKRPDAPVGRGDQRPKSTAVTAPCGRRREMRVPGTSGAAGRLPSRSAVAG